MHNAKDHGWTYGLRCLLETFPDVLGALHNRGFAH